MYYNPIAAGERIENLRRELKLTQEQLADQLNIGDRHIRTLEKGEGAPSIDLFVEIAAFFGVSLDFLLDFLIIGYAPSDREESVRKQIVELHHLNQKLKKFIKEIAKKVHSIEKII